MIEWVHPTALFFVAAAALPFLKGKAKQAALLGAPLLSFLLLLIAKEGNHGVLPMMGQELIFGRVDKLSLVFGYVFCIAAFIGMVYSLHVKSDREHMAALIYAGSSLGVVFSGDLMTLFLFWEFMAFSSALLVFFRGPDSSAAGMRYLLVHIFGGVVLLIGIFIYAGGGGGIAFNKLPHSGIGPMLILLGFIINAAVPPFHAWLPDAYPESTITGIVFMSAFTTKTAVYVLVRGFPGTEILVFLGVTMALYGVVYAVLENDIRRLLAYHIISQVGYMVAGVGMGTELALNGAVSHAYAHILYKGLLMMGMSSVLLMTGKKNLTDLGGLYKTMPITFILYMVGGFAISAFPLFSGFVSKSMVVSAAAEAHRPAVTLLLTMASAGTFLHTGLKLPYYVFFGRDAGIVAKDPPHNMIIGMGLAAFMCILLGVAPGVLYRSLPFPVEYHPYTGDHVVGALLMLLFTALGFFMLLKKLDPEPTISVDTDWLYRKGIGVFLWLANHPLARYEQTITEAYQYILIEPTKRFSQIAWSFDTWVIDGLVNASGWVTLLESKISEIFDAYVIDGAVNGVSATLDVGARGLRRLQTGAVQNYVLAMVMGIVVLAIVFMF
jgi:multicomponent Na+:H+ antiporter subunit D